MVGHVPYGKVISIIMLFSICFLQHYGKEIIAKELQRDDSDPDVQRLYLAIYKSFIEVLGNWFFLHPYCNATYLTYAFNCSYKLVY